MNKEEQEQKKFLEELIQWSKDRDSVLVEIEIKLYEMKAIAEYAAAYHLSIDERKQLNQQLDELKDEVSSLEEKLHTTVH